MRQQNISRVRSFRLRALAAVFAAICLLGGAWFTSGASAAQKKDPTLGVSKKPPGKTPARPRAGFRPKIILSMTPADCSVALDDVAKQPGKDGLLEIEVGVGETHLLRVSGDGNKYTPRNFEIVVTEDEEKQLTGKVSEKRAIDDPISDQPLLQFEQPVSKEEPIKLDIVLPPARALFMIVNAPVGAGVTLDGKKIGEISAEGSYVGKADPGRHQIGLQAEGYLFESIESDLAAGVSFHRINYNMPFEKQKKGAIEIAAGVPRSQVLLRVHAKDPNSPEQYVLFASVGARGRALVPNLTPGLYDLFIETPDKQQWGLESCLVASNKITTVEYKTGQSAPAYRDIDQLTAEISAGQTAPGPGAPGSGAADKTGGAEPPAPETLKPSPVPFAIEGNLRAVKIAFDDQPEFALPDSPGDLKEVTGQIAGRAVTFKVDAQAGAVKLSAEDIGPGAHKLKISRKDYRPWSQEFNGVAGQPVTLSAKLDPIPWEERVFRWKDTSSHGGIRGALALSANGQRAYVMSDSGSLLAYDVSSSAEAQARHAPAAQFSVNDSFAGFPVVAPDGTIILVQGNGIVRGLLDRGSSFDQKWEPNTEPKGSIVAPPAVTADGQILVVGTSVGVVGLSVASGLRVWRKALDGPVIGSPVVGADGTIYVITGAGNLYALKPDGSAKWQTPYTIPGADGSASPAIDARGILYVSAQDGYVHAIRDTGASGVKVWQSGSRLGTHIASSPVITASGNILAGSKGMVISALDPTGTLLWSYSKTPAETEAIGGLTLASDGSIYAALSDGSLLVLNQDGSLKGKFQTAGSISPAPVITNDGLILFGCSDGTVYALKEENGGLSQSAQWPTLQHDLRRSGRAVK